MENVESGFVSMRLNNNKIREMWKIEDEERIDEYG